MATKGPAKAASTGAGLGSTAVEATMTAKELAAAKRQKKREVDRRCQREARQRTKARIAYLEELVDELRQQDTSGQVASLMEQVSAARTERDQFARTLRGIEDAIRGHQTMLDKANASITKQEPDSQDEDYGGIEPMSATMQAIASFPQYEVTMDMDGATYDETTLQLSTTKSALVTSQFAATHSQSTTVAVRHTTASPIIRRDSILPPQREPCLSCTPGNPTDPRPQSLWRFANEVLNAAPRLTERELRWEDQCAEDTPVRAAVEGWEAVERRLGGTLPPLWRTLRRIDEGIFKNIAPKERLAIMRLMHLLYRYHADPATQQAEIPSWFLARPSQNIEHAYAIDFLCWPGVRERFVFSEHSYCTDLFWHLVNKSLQILWQYDFRDCYVIDRTTGAYRVSPAFDARIADINAWAMGPAFFRAWPELYADIPSWEKTALPMERLGATAAARNQRVLLRGTQILPGKKFIGHAAGQFGDMAVENGGGGGGGGDEETDADADGVDDDELADRLAADAIAREDNDISPHTIRGMESVSENDWLWLQGVDGMDTGQMGSMGA